MTETQTAPPTPTVGEVVAEAGQPATGGQITEIRSALVQLQHAFAHVTELRLDLNRLTRLEADMLFGNILEARDAVRKIQ